MLRVMVPDSDAGSVRFACSQAVEPVSPDPQSGDAGSVPLGMSAKDPIMPLVGYSGLQWHAAADEAPDTARYGLKGNRSQIHCRFW